MVGTFHFSAVLEDGPIRVYFHRRYGLDDNVPIKRMHHKATCEGRSFIAGSRDCQDPEARMAVIIGAEQGTRIRHGGQQPNADLPLADCTLSSRVPREHARQTTDHVF